jgi:hypothetical protein
MSGTILRGDDGSLYFIRDEVLEACKVEGEYVDRVQHMLDGEAEVEGFFSFNLAPATDSLLGALQPLGYAQTSTGSTLASRPAVTDRAGSTLMCPWA